VYCAEAKRVKYERIITTKIRPSNIPEDWRLIETQYKSEWLSPEAVGDLVQECGKQDHQGFHGFFDITDFPFHGKIKVPEPSPLPDFCSYDSKVVDPLLAKIQKKNWEDKVIELSAIPTRYYASTLGQRGAETIYGWLEQICAGKCKPEFFVHSWVQNSVILRIPGNDPKGEVVIIGAHQDSIATNVNLAPGADDDASGCSAILEIARVLIDSNFVPNRTLEFHFYSAEEVGLRGSQDISAKYAAEGVNVYAMIQFDMIGYTQNRPPVFITDFVNSPLTTCLRQLAAQIGTIEWGSSTCGYGCSDHASWTKANYRSSFPFECDFRYYNTRIHTANDLINILNSDHAKHFIELGVAATVSLTTI